MVEYALSLDDVFGSLANPTRRDILKRLSKDEMTISELAGQYKITFSAISKHLKVLEKARLIIKSKRGKEQLVRLSPKSLEEASDYLNFYKDITLANINSLNNYINKE